MAYDTVLSALTSSRYAQLRTYRRDGSPVDTPIWFHVDGDTLIFRTKEGPKTRRIDANPAVQLWPCDYRGRYAEGSPIVAGRATVVAGAAAEAANHALHRRYGWQYNVVPLLKLPGVTNVHANLPLREKLRWARTRSLWPDSAVVEVKFIPADSKNAPPELFSIQDDLPRRA